MDTATPPVASIGIHIGKGIFHIVGFGADGKVAFRRGLHARDVARVQASV
jgi:transposase